MAKKTPPVEYLPDGPIMKCMSEPQLMHVQLRIKSSYIKNKRINEEMNLEFKKKGSDLHCCGRYIKE